MVSTRATAVMLLALALVSSVSADGSTITVSTTQFNPAIQNQGGTTNAAGTFNVSPLATSTSYAFQTLQQTSTFEIGPVNTQGSSSGNSGSGNSGSSGNSGNSGGGSGNFGGSTVVVTATAPTSTVRGGSSTGGSGGSTAAGTASNGLPSLAFGASSNGALASGRGESMVGLAFVVMAMSAAFGAFVVV